jgi:hypothetical protein
LYSHLETDAHRDTVSTTSVEAITREKELAGVGEQHGDEEKR